MRVLRSLVVLALLALAATALAGTGQQSSQAAALRAEGAVSLTNSLGNGAIFTASSLGPGGSATGRVAIRNTGTRPARLALTQSDLEDVLGPGGGRLSDLLQLTVRDVGAARTVYDGPFASMPRSDAGALAPGQARTYELSARLPRSGGNAFQSSSARIRYVWTATETAPGPASPPTAGAPPRPVPAAPCRPSLRVPVGQRLLARRSMIARVRVTRSCRVTARAFVRDHSGRRRFLFGLKNRELAAGRVHRVRLRLAPSVRRILRSRRSRHVKVSVVAGGTTLYRRARVR